MKAEWFNSHNYSPFGDLYKEEFHLSDERTKREVEQIEMIFKRYLPSSSFDARILDVAGGFGRISSRLVDNGYKNITNVDLNFEFLKETKRFNIASFKADMRFLPFQKQSFDAAMLIFTSFGYFDNHADNMLVLQEIKRVVKKSGLFLLDMPNYHVLQNNFVSSRKIDLSVGTIIYNKTVHNNQLIESRTLITNKESVSLPPIKLTVYKPEEIKQMLLDIEFSEVVLFNENLESYLHTNARRVWIIGIL